MATHLNSVGRSQRSTTTMEIKWITKRQAEGKNLKASRIPILISTNPNLINPQTLKDLYSNCNHSADRNGSKGVEEAVDLKKLRVALSHSSILVSVFCNLRDRDGEGGERGLGDLVRTMMPMVSPSDGELVGFGRAVSDFGLTAAIYDVMVIPSLQRMGIGKMIVNRMIRILTSRDIYDISALCSINESLFFKACGFGDDLLGSTTMMYTRTGSTYSEGEQMVKQAGRRLLLVPPLRIPTEP
ncbi:Acyl-CoA N-acyltransferases (NAT) superfamily protein [Euphorbia peplus]|nr:Acyl-CoA N-acyltransferases (NAT) superfamily protein [Euphorbia peplus]